MMGKQSGNQQKLFYYDISLEHRVPQNHILRKIKKAIDFALISKEVGEIEIDRSSGSQPGYFADDMMGISFTPAEAAKHTSTPVEEDD